MPDISEFEKIHSYVTWPDREKEYFDDGSVSIGSLGFPQVNVSGNANDGTCDPETEPVTFNHTFAVGYTVDPSIAEAICYRPTSNFDLSSNELVIPFKMFSYTQSTGLCVAAVADDIMGLIPFAETIQLVAVGFDDLVATNILNGTVGTITSIRDNTRLSFNLTFGTSESVPENNLTFGEGVIGLKIIADTTKQCVVHLTNQDDEDENGVYIYAESTRTGDMNWRKVGEYVAGGSYLNLDDRKDPSKYPPADPTVNDNVGGCCNHFRKGYSAREVADYVSEKVGVATHFGVHPETKSQLDCAGGFIKWFTSLGTVDIGNGQNNPVYVNGFGLGDVYLGKSQIPEYVEPEPSTSDGVMRPWLVWAYGSKWSNVTPDTNIVALPKDWPFSGSSNYASRTTNNNITLVTHADDGTEAGIGNLVSVDEDGNKIRRDRHHIVIYNDFETNTASAPSGYKDGSTVIKPLFVHIPASMDTNDGDTFDITVSLVNTNMDKAYTGNNMAADLSAYYSVMSKPRVFIMGGAQRFSSKRLVARDPLPSDMDDEEFYLTVNGKIIGDDGTELVEGDVIRCNLMSTLMEPSERMFRGEITEIGETTTTLKLTGKFPYDIGGRKWKANTLSVCGIAYLPHEEINNPTNTPMGLISRQSSILGVDYGQGESGDFDEYNKFYSLTERDGFTAFGGDDKRYLLATVYQGATNTFPWRLTGRKKLKYAEYCMTDEFDRGPNSVIAQIIGKYRDFMAEGEWYEFVKPLKHEPFVQYRHTYPVRTTIPINEGESTIGSSVNFFLSSLMGPANIYTNSQPVRQAKLAYKSMLNDLRNMRLSRVGDLAQYKGSLGIPVNMNRVPTEVPNYQNIINSVSAIVRKEASDNSVYNGSAASCLRHLPLYITDIDNLDKTFTPADGFGDNQFFSSATFGEYLEYSSVYRVSDDEYRSVGCTEDVPCDLVGSPAKSSAFAKNSFIDHVLGNRLSTINNVKKYNDARRYVETSMILSVPDIATHLGGELYTDGTDIDLNDEIWTPFTKLFALDMTVYPQIAKDDADALPETQRAFVDMDAAQMIRYGVGEDYDIFATVMPSTPAVDPILTFAKDMIVMYGAKFKKHAYCAERILLANFGFESEDDISYKKSVVWMHSLFEDCGENGAALFNHYLNDNFAMSSSVLDPNIDFTNVAKSDGTYSIENNLSAPPYTIDPSFYNRFGATYTRVFMQFTFSAQAGRWYTTDYRQVPVCYLTPLYGADTFSETMYTVFGDYGQFDPNIKRTTGHGATHVKPIWRNSACTGFNGYKSTLYLPYSEYPSMDFTLGCIPYMYGTDDEWPYNSDGTVRVKYSFGLDFADAPQLNNTKRPYLPVSQNGLSLYPPSNVNGEYNEETNDGPHANFWSVRKFLRPAVSALKGTDVPGMESRTDGNIADASLFAMFDFPVANTVEYHLPGTVDPSVDMANPKLVKIDGDDESTIAQIKHLDGAVGYVTYAERDVQED